MRLCSVPGCGRKHRCGGYCNSHYAYAKRHGVVPMHLIAEPLTADERFWQKVDRTATCWLWTGSVAGRTAWGAYGRFEGKQAHRWSYERFVGPIPEALTLDHLCRVTLCVNPAHLEPVTQRENILRGTAPAAVNHRKTHCKRGHLLNGDNVRATPKGGRACRACDSLHYEARRLGLHLSDLETGSAA